MTVERRYVVEYVSAKWPRRIEARFNVALGAPPEILEQMYPAAPKNSFQRWRRYVDAVVILSKELYIIEAKVWHPKTGIADLLEYRELVPQTPELAPYLNRTTIYLLVVPFFRDVWIQQAKREGFAIDLYQPKWLIPHLKRRNLI